MWIYLVICPLPPGVGEWGTVHIRQGAYFSVQGFRLGNYMPRLQQATLGGVWMVVNDSGMVPVDGMVCGERMLCCS